MQFEAVDIAESMWTLDEGTEPGREPSKVLLISLVKPQPTEDELAWKKGETWVGGCIDEWLLQWPHW